MSPDQGHGESVLTAADGQYPGPELVALVPTHPASQPRTCGLSTLGRRPGSADPGRARSRSRVLAGHHV